MKKNEDYPIDVVIYWVDGSDPKWRNKKNLYKVKKNQEAGAARYRDWDNLQYWFRGIEKYAPWVNKVFFISDEQIPEWLNVDNPKLVIVDHKDYIPEAYLPTFKSRCIELNIHRIKELSEHFIVFNDDFFLTNYVSKEDFFKNGLPVDIFMEYPIMCSGKEYTLPFEFANMFNTISRYIGPRKEYKKRLRWKILSPKYGWYFFYNLAMYLIPFPKFFGLLTPHFARPYRKSDFEELWEAEYDRLNDACMEKFRCDRDYNVWTVRLWNLAHGNFVPGNIYKLGKAYFVKDDCSNVCAAIEKGKYQLICINDDVEDDDMFEKAKKCIRLSFDKILPTKSSFEL